MRKRLSDDPHGVWRVTYFNRYRYLEVEVQARNEGLARTMGFHSLCRDGIDGRTLTFVKAERIE